MNPIDGKEFNDMFGEALSRGGEHLDKVAEVTGLYIQEKLRENSFARRILPPQTVTVAELTRNVSDESLVYIDDLEPDSIAMRINMRGEPDKTYIQAPRYAIRMQTITSDRFQKTEQELRSYRMPLTKVIEQNTVKDIQEQMDVKFMEHVRIGLMFATIARKNELVDAGRVQDDQLSGTSMIVSGDPGSGKNFRSALHFASYLLTGKVASTDRGGALTINIADKVEMLSAGTYSPVDGFFTNILLSQEASFNREVLASLVKICAARQVKARVILMHEFDWADHLAWTDQEAGLEIVKEIVVGGYKYTTVGGYTYVTTIRDNAAILEPGQIYVFPAPEFLGRFLVLQNTQFYINKEGRFFNMEAWEECGVGFGNVKGLGMVLLNGASVKLPNLFHEDNGTATATGDNPVAGMEGVTGEFTLTNAGTDATVVSAS
jgi:hypothetical protein